MKNVRLYLVDKLFTSMDTYRSNMLQSLLKEAQEQTGSAIYIYKHNLLKDFRVGTPFDEVKILPKNMHQKADLYIEYRDGVRVKKSNIIEYLSQYCSSNRPSIRQLLQYLPSSCHFIYDTDLKIQSVSDIPDWVHDIVNECLMLRTLYEMP